MYNKTNWIVSPFIDCELERHCRFDLYKGLTVKINKKNKQGKFSCILNKKWCDTGSNGREMGMSVVHYF